MICHIKVTGQLNQLLQFTAFPFLTNMQAIYIIFLHIHVVKYASIYMYIYITQTNCHTQQSSIMQSKKHWQGGIE